VTEFQEFLVPLVGLELPVVLEHLEVLVDLVAQVAEMTYVR
jgi:hypothetical protein